MKPLSVDKADIIDDEWSNKHDGSLFLVKRLIEWNSNIAAFNDKNELMGWSLRLQAGSLGALQVREKFKRRGIGSILVLAMCKILANSELDTFALVGEKNLASRNMFNKLGFKHTDDCFWLKTYSIDKTFQWSDDNVNNNLI